MHVRKRTRLSGFDYGWTGAYFVTVCASRRGAAFGVVRDGSVCLDEVGTVVEEALAAIPHHHAVAVDASVVMPDHVHAILILGPTTRRETLSSVVGAFKARATRRLGRAIWQRGFYDHVVRDDADLERVREYIETNPLRWELRMEAEGRRAEMAEGPDRSGPYDHLSRRAEGPDRSGRYDHLRPKGRTGPAPTTSRGDGPGPLRRHAMMGRTGPATAPQTVGAGPVRPTS
jgi:putative transposase